MQNKFQFKSSFNRLQIVASSFIGDFLMRIIYFGDPSFKLTFYRIIWEIFIRIYTTCFYIELPYMYVFWYIHVFSIFVTRTGHSIQGSNDMVSSRTLS